MSPLVQLILGLAPGLVEMIKSAHRTANPDAPALTSEEVLASFEQAFTDSDAKDEMMKNVLTAELTRNPNA